MSLKYQLTKQRRSKVMEIKLFSDNELNIPNIFWEFAGIALIILAFKQ